VKTAEKIEKEKTFFFSEVTNNLTEDRNINLLTPGLKEKQKHNFYKIHSN
jgi:hypothetical protein